MSQAYPYNQPDQAYPLNQLYQLLVNYVNQQASTISSAISVPTIQCTAQVIQASWQACLVPPALLAVWLGSNQLSIDQASAYLNNWWQSQIGAFIYAQQINNDYHVVRSLLRTASVPLLPWVSLINDSNMTLEAISGLFSSQYIIRDAYINLITDGLPQAVNVTNWAGVIEYAPSSYLVPYIPYYVSVLSENNVNVTNLIMIINSPVIDVNRLAQIISYPNINITGMVAIITNPALNTTQITLAINQVPVVGDAGIMAMVLTNSVALTTATYIFNNAIINYSSAGLIISNPAVNVPNAQVIFNNVLNLNWSGVVYMLNAAYPNYTTMGAVAVNPSVNITYMAYVLSSPAINYTNVAPIISAPSVNYTTAAQIVTSPIINFTAMAYIITSPTVNLTNMGYIYAEPTAQPAGIYYTLSNANVSTTYAQSIYYSMASAATTYGTENIFIGFVTYNQPAVTLSANVSATWTLFYSSLSLNGYTLTMGTAGRPSVIVTYAIQMSGGAIVQQPTGAPGGGSTPWAGGAGGGGLVVVAVTGYLDGLIVAVGQSGVGATSTICGAPGSSGGSGYLITIEGIVYTASTGGLGGNGGGSSSDTGGGGGGGYVGGPGGGGYYVGGPGGSVVSTLNYSTRWSYVYTMLQFLGDEWQRYILGRTLPTYIGATYLAGYGSGGGCGACVCCACAAGGGGGMGGQVVIYMQNLYAPTTNQIIAMGGSGGVAYACAGGAGGGAGGLVYILTHNLVAFSGTINVLGGIYSTGVSGGTAGTSGAPNTYAIFIV